MLEKRIDEDVKSALKKKNAIKVLTLRMLRSDILNTKIKLNKKELKDEDVVKVIKHQVKQHRESIEQFEKGNRLDLVDKEKAELDILLSYMPETISADEIKKIAEAAIKELEAASKKDMGKVIKAVMEKAKGRADGKEVSRIVKDLLP